jgi:hypothetical protein
MVAAARILSQRYHDKKNDVRPPLFNALVRGRRNNKLNIKHGTRVLNMAIRVILFAIIRKRAAQRLKDFENEFLYFFPAEIRLN